MKLIKMEFDSEQDRDVAVRTMIAMREKTPEPVFAAEYKPTLFVWESEKREFEQHMARRGIPCRVNSETEISDSALA